MCRWIAYVGSPLWMDSFLVRPENSLLAQSRNAHASTHPMNADGFGIGWYGEREKPGVFRAIVPAWNDPNFRNLAEQIRCRLFFAHVRSATGTPVQLGNCHPFRRGNWLFQHNGIVPGYDVLRRRMDFAIAPDLYPTLEGTTDSERMFLLAITLGLSENAPRALQRMVGFLEELRHEHRIEDPLVMTIAATDGARIFALRYASHGPSPTLYHSSDIHALRDVGGACEAWPADGVILASEPLDSVGEHWRAVEESMLLVAEPGRVVRQPLGLWVAADGSR
ncbi:MAG: class II glutamine amidotransferase [bacterium]